jgi:hypothetical protein
MKVVVLDRNLAVLDYFSLLLTNCKMDVTTFSEEEECLKYLDDNKDVDFLFIEKFFWKKFVNKYLDSFLIILSFEIKELNMNRIHYKPVKEFELRPGYERLWRLKRNDWRAFAKKMEELESALKAAGHDMRIGVFYPLGGGILMF